MIKGLDYPSQKARDYCFLLLKFRARSRDELYTRLKKKKYEEAVIKETLDFLQEKHFIDDNAFARAWISSRIKKPLGLRKLRQELSFKGVDKKIIDAEIGQISRDYPEEDIVFELAKAKFSKIKGIEPDKAKRRVYSFLVARGFSLDAVIEAMNKL